ncbi:hypothetical protein GQX74_009952 [Glossina fuscipes]|nr:hypothetical protein GQX74_009952 [Glossina fuscipes]
MNPSIRRNSSSRTANLTPATRFDRAFQRFQLGKQNTTEEYLTCSSSARLFESFLMKVDNFFEMPNGESQDNSHNTVGNVTEDGNSSNNQQGSQAEMVDPNQQLMNMRRQQNEASLSCMQEIGNLRNQEYIGVRQSQIRGTEGAQNFGIAAATSAPKQHAPSQVIIHRNDSPQPGQQNQRADDPRTNDESTRRRNINLNVWHLKFNGSG